MASESDDPAFELKIQSAVHIEGGNLQELRSAFAITNLPDTVPALIERRVEQAGGSLSFDLRDLRPDLQDAAFLYLGAATYCFESNPGYRYSAIRFEARKTLLDYGIRPLSTSLRHAGFRAETQLELAEIELGSLKFLQTVAVVMSIAATGPAVYRNLNEIYLPQARILKTKIEQYVADYFETLEKLGVDVSHRTPPINIPETPQLPQQRDQRRRKVGGK